MSGEALSLCAVPSALQARSAAFPIKRDAFAIHGISKTPQAGARAVLSRDGKEARPVLQSFFKLVAEAKAAGVPIVAHNASFDVSRLKKTAEVHGMPDGAVPIDAKEALCTMQTSRAAVDARDRRGHRKAPRLDELHEYLFDRPPAGRMHAALDDVRALAKCYVEGKKRELW